jgi:hypothetical protein
MAYVSDQTGRREQARSLRPREIIGGAADESKTASAEALELTDDSSSGLALFVLFTMAVLVVTGAVALLALLNSWWVLGLAFGVHVLLTIVVGSSVFAVLSNGKPILRSADSSSTDTTPGLESQAAGSPTEWPDLPHRGVRTLRPLDAATPLTGTRSR